VTRVAPSRRSSDSGHARGPRADDSVGLGCAAEGTHYRSECQRESLRGLAGRGRVSRRGSCFGTLSFCSRGLTDRVVQPRSTSRAFRTRCTITNGCVWSGLPLSRRRTRGGLPSRVSSTLRLSQPQLGPRWLDIARYRAATLEQFSLEEKPR